MKNLSVLILLSFIIFTSCKDDESVSPTFQEVIEGDWELFSTETKNCDDPLYNQSFILAEEGCIELDRIYCNRLNFDSNGILITTDGALVDTFNYTVVADSSMVFICGNTMICNRMYYEEGELIANSVRSGCESRVFFIKR